jgi:hypothetical protein
MGNIIFKILLIFILLGSLNCFSQNQNHEQDSVAITNIAKDFFSWYMSITKYKDNGGFYPVFVQDNNGMTTLDYSKYIQSLIKHSFSDSLIAKEKTSYQLCIKNLSKVKYSDFLKFEDLNDFESRNCDFNNYYRWIGGQEIFDGYSVSKVKFDKKKAFVNGFLFNNNHNGKKIIEKDIIVTFIRQNDKWKISDIKY